jgi:uncharacterized protein YdaU (DUF1376 family)
MHLSPTAIGAYILLILAYWRMGCLPDDDQQLCRITRLTADEWATARPTIAAFFHDGWRHRRIDAEIAKFEAKHSRRAEAGKRGGNATATARQCSSNATSIAAANAEQCSSNATSNAAAMLQHLSYSESDSKKDSELRSSDALPASRDIRGELFGRGLKTLAEITGKTPDSCRSLVGRWLKTVNDEAIHVLGAIEDAERNRVADPVAWITQMLKPHGTDHGKRAFQNAGKRTVQDAARDLASRFGDVPAADSRRARGNSPRLLSSR